MRLLEEMKVRRLFCDDGMGSMLQTRGFQVGEMPEMWNPTHPKIVRDIHRQYLKAGADIMEIDTFRVNGLKYKDNLEEIIAAAVGHAKAAVEEAGHGYVALDVGSTGRLLKPLGDLDFEDAVGLYKEVVAYGVKAGVDLVLIATMSDSYELKAAVLTAKEARMDSATGENIPMFTSVTSDEKGKLLTGENVESTVALSEGPWANVLRISCGLGPEQMKGILKDILEAASLPIMVNPNAGLPRSENGKTVYDINEGQFVQVMREIVDMGAAVVGGCCSTTPDHIRETVKLRKDIPVRWPEKKRCTVISSYAWTVVVDRETVIIEERINLTGKPKFKQALRDHNLEYILREGVSQQDNGVDMLDVNMGLPEIDESSMMEEVVKELQSIIDLPLRIDTLNTEITERATRVYNGKPLINSVNGKAEVMSQVFPLVAKYDSIVMGLCLDEGRIPETAEGRIVADRKVTDTAADYGIRLEDIILNGLCTTVSSGSRGAPTTLETLRRIRDELGGRSVLGVPNIPFGLPQREIINRALFTIAMEAGLNAAIINPNSGAMMCALYNFNALMDRDPQCSRYISIYSGQVSGFGWTIGEDGVGQVADNGGQVSGASSVLSGGEDAGVLPTSATERGLKDTAHQAVGVLLEKRDALDIVNDHMIPALDRVGKGFEKRIVFLPQLLMSTEVAEAAFKVTKTRMDQSGQVQEKKGIVILVTVKGDIHDIGKNIVKVLLENYGYDVMGLRKDVPPERIVEEAIKGEVLLVGPSASMTTTASNMEETIQKLRATASNVKVMVEGAVLTKEYAQTIGADMHYRDVVASANYAESIFVR